MTEVELLREIIKTQTGQIEALLRQVAALTEEVQKLREELERKNTNSRNSSKPPSSDGYSKPAPKSLKQSSGKKPGGQKGHKGNSMKIMREPDEVVPHDPITCASCPKRALCAMQVAERRYEQDMQWQRSDPVTTLRTFRAILGTRQRRLLWMFTAM